MRLLRGSLLLQAVAAVPPQALLRKSAHSAVPAMRQDVLHAQQPQEAPQVLPPLRLRQGQDQDGTPLGTHVLHTCTPATV